MMLRKTITVKRKPPGNYINGIWQDGELQDLTIQASIQPTSPNDLENLAEGRFMNNTYKLYSSEPFQSADDNANLQPDMIILPEGNFEVVSCQYWQNSIISHYKTIISKLPENAN